MPPPAPYLPVPAGFSPLRYMFRSQAEVLRLVMTLDDAGAGVLSWSRITDIIDPWLAVPGQMMCRVDLGFVRRGIDALMPVMAGRAPDRTGLLFCDATPDAHGQNMVKAGDRIHMLAGPIFGTFEIRQVPDVAQNFIGASHIETQVIEVAHSLSQDAPAPFPGSQGPDA